MAVYSLVSGTWRENTSLSSVVSSSWREVESAYAMAGGVWREVFSSSYIHPPTVAVQGAASDSPSDPLIQSSLVNVDMAQGKHISTDWEVRTSSNSLVWSSTNNTTNLYMIKLPKGTLNRNTNYVARCRYYVEFVPQLVNAPVLVVTGTPSSVPESPTLQASTSVLSGFSGTHHSTDWAVRTANNSVVWFSMNNTTNKTSIVVPSGYLSQNVTYYFQCRFILQN